jgi:hypothetical protein
MIVFVSFFQKDSFDVHQIYSIQHVSSLQDMWSRNSAFYIIKGSVENHELILNLKPKFEQEPVVPSQGPYEELIRKKT